MEPVGTWDTYVKARWWNCRQGTVIYRINDIFDEGRTRVMLTQEELVKRVEEFTMRSVGRAGRVLRYYLKHSATHCIEAWPTHFGTSYTADHNMPEVNASVHYPELDVPMSCSDRGVAMAEAHT